MSVASSRLSTSSAISAHVGSLEVEQATAEQASVASEQASIVGSVPVTLAHSLVSDGIPSIGVTGSASVSVTAHLTLSERVFLR